MKNILKFSSYFLFLSLLIGCSSPLEEVEINNFNLIRANFNVVKNVASNGVVNDVVEVSIRDKNYKGFKLNGGVVTVNGSLMEYNNGALENKYTSNIEIVPNTQYNFVVTLSNGKSTSTVLTTPGMSYKSLTYDKEFTIGTDYSISWDAGINPVKIKFILDDNLFGQNPHYDYRTSMQNDNGMFLIDGTETMKYPQRTECYFDVTFIGGDQSSEEFKSTISTSEIVYSARDITVVN